MDEVIRLMRENEEMLRSPAGNSAGGQTQMFRNLHQDLGCALTPSTKDV